MKPYIHAIVAIAGFVTAAGTISIFSAEYQLVRTGRDAVASILIDKTTNREAVASRYDFRTLDAGLSDKDVRSQVDAALKADKSLPAPNIVIDAGPAEHAKLSMRRTAHARAAKRAVLALHPRTPVPPTAVVGIPSDFRFAFPDTHPAHQPTIPKLPRAASIPQMQFKFDAEQFAGKQKELAMWTNAEKDKQWIELKKLSNVGDFAVLVHIPGDLPAKAITVDPKEISRQAEEIQRQMRDAQNEAENAAQADQTIEANN